MPSAEAAVAAEAYPLTNSTHTATCPQAHLQRCPQLLLVVQIGSNGTLSQQIAEPKEQRAADALSGAMRDAHISPGLGGGGAAEYSARLLVDHLGLASNGELQTPHSGH